MEDYGSLSPPVPPVQPTKSVTINPANIVNNSKGSVLVPVPVPASSNRDEKEASANLEAENLTDEILQYQQTHSRIIIFGTCLLLTERAGLGRQYFSPIVVSDICKNILQSKAQEDSFEPRTRRLKVVYNSVLCRLFPLLSFPRFDDPIHVQVYFAKAIQVIKSDCWTLKDLANVAVPSAFEENDIDLLVINTIVNNKQEDHNALIATYLRTMKSVSRQDASFNIGDALKWMRKKQWPEYIVRVSVAAWAIEYRNEIVFKRHTGEISLANAEPESEAKSQETSEKMEESESESESEISVTSRTKKL